MYKPTSTTSRTNGDHNQSFATQQIHWPEIQNTISTQTPWQLTWQKHEQYDRLYNPIVAHLQPSIHIKDWETPNILTQGGIFHCLTTQAPTDDGRPPPQHANVDQATWDRWQTSHKQFPPLQYKPQYLTRYKDNEWTTLSPIQRETHGVTGWFHTEQQVP